MRSNVGHENGKDDVKAKQEPELNVEGADEH